MFGKSKSQKLEAKEPMSFENLMALGMKRNLPELLTKPDGKFEIAVGETGEYQSCDQTHGFPDWWWPDDGLPYSDGEVGLIHCYHFMEHLSGNDAIRFLLEVQRVLCSGGIFQFCIPLAGTEISFQDLTHRSFWTGDSFKILFNNGYYNPTEGGITWSLKTHYLVIAGVTQRNLSILGQLVKE